MKKVLFSHSYFLRFDPKQWNTGQPYAPLGTLYAAAFLRENGYIVSLFDSMFAQRAEELISSLDSFEPQYFVIYDDGFNYLTKMCLTNMREAAFRMSKLAKERGCTVIVASSDSTDHYEQYLQEGADFIVLGEGEVTLYELIKAHEASSASLQSLPGIAYRKGDAIIKTGKRPVIKDLDSLPFPAWDLVNMEPYRQMWLQHAGYFSINMGTTRGCPFKCNWCAKPIYGNRYNSRSPQHVVQELKWLKEQYHFDHIWFCDDIFGLKPGWVQEFATLTQQANLQLRFKIQSRADLLVQENYIRSLAQAGCENTWMGAESGSQAILDAMDKGTTIEQIHTATQLLKQYGIRPAFFIQFGYPGETKEDIRKTIHMIKELMPAELGISVSYPLPGTLFYERVKNELQEKANWTDSDELQLMFKNTYSPAFYKKLHRHVHHVFRTRQGWLVAKKAMRNPLALKLTDIKKIAAACLFLPRILIGRFQLKQLSYE
jgi:radical SAM superfamily enzyme YgiQ (UPF0313 family)